MNKECEIVRDILPLYADHVCSDTSREIIDEHLKTCPDCGAYLEKIRASEAESELRDEKAQVLKYQVRRFKRRSAAVGSIISALFMVPILICLIVNLTSGRTLDWFFIVVAGMLVAASLTVVPVMAPENKLFWTLCAFTVSLILLLAVCALYTHGDWFFVAASASIFGLSVIFLPFAIKSKPLRPWVEGHNKTLLVLAVDGILFASMLNVISLHQKGLGFTIVMEVFAAAALGLLALGVVRRARGK
jgi:hypothetical protein